MSSVISTETGFFLINSDYRKIIPWGAKTLNEAVSIAAKYRNSTAFTGLAIQYWFRGTPLKVFTKEGERIK